MPRRGPNRLCMCMPPISLEVNMQRAGAIVSDLLTRTPYCGSFFFFFFSFR
ncbi:hypothetical protein ACKS23_00841 [Histoplasma ohiense]